MTPTPETTQELANMQVRIEKEIRIEAPLDVSFAVLLEMCGPGMPGSDGKSMGLKVEPFPGGRWYRDLGNDDGHLWGHVQAIKRPTLLEFRGPFFMSAPTTNNLQYRLEEDGGATVLKMVHTAFGPMPEGMGDGMASGWEPHLKMIRDKAEATAKA